MEISLTIAEKISQQVASSTREECAKIAESFAIHGLRFKNPGDMALAIARAIRDGSTKASISRL